MENYRLFERSSQKIWYEANFQEWLKENRHLPDSVLKLINGLKKEGQPASKDGIKVTCIDINKEDNILYSKSFKVAVDDQNFFLKLENESIEEEGGFREMESTLLAKEELKAMEAQGVRVIKPIWGYEDQQEHRSYFIAEWLDFPILDDVLNDLKKNYPQKANKLLERVSGIQKALKGYREVSPANMFYDKSKDEIILFDLHV